MNFTMVDYVVIGVISLAAIIGLVRGFIKVLFSLCKGVLTFGGAYLLCKPLATFAASTGVANPINSQIANWVLSKNDVFSQPVTSGSGQIIADNLGLPGFITKYVVNIINNSMESLAGSGLNIGQAVADTLTFYVLMAISFLVLLIVLSILVRIISSLVTKVFDSTFLRPANKILGFAFGAVIGVIVVSVIFFAAGALSSLIPSLAEFIENEINPASDIFGLSRWLYNNNFLVWIFDSMISTDNISWTGA